MKPLSSSPNLELERTRRMAQCWREHVPSDFEVGMARCRFKARSEATRLTPPTSHAVIFGLVLALSSVVPLIPARSPELNAPLESADLKAPTFRELALTPPPAPVIGSAKEIASPAPVIAQQKKASRSARRPARSNVRRQQSTEKDRPALAAVSPEVSFAHVADAGFRPDPLTRDVAALSRAYLLVSDGRAERARGLLERLADRGATAGIRKRANELLMRASEPPPSSLLFLMQRSNGLG